MNEKSKFYVFERKEIILLVVLVILTSITSFMFGAHIASEYSFNKSGNNSSDLQQITTETKKVDFASQEEEKVEELVKKEEKKVDINKKIEDSLKQKMIEEFSQENKKFVKPAPVQKEVKQVQQPAMQESIEMVERKDVEQKAEQTSDDMGQDSFKGKYTAQLSSFQSLAEAKEFAEGFKVLGYNPIIYEKNIPGRGNWFRVSIGVFGSLTELKAYILKNKSLFAERDYVPRKFD